MKRRKPKTKKPTEAELRAFAEWCAKACNGMNPKSFDWERFGKLVEAKAQELLREKCVECGK